MPRSSEMISIVVPCYNEQDALPVFMEELIRVMDLMRSEHKNLTFEVVLVDDGSTDGTRFVMRGLSQQQTETTVRYVSFSRNFGKEAALLAGLRFSKGDLVAVMDADMQDPPEMLIEMYHELQLSDCDQVAACRKNREGEPVVRSAFAKLFYRIINKISDVEIVDGARDFRLMKRIVVDSVLLLSERNRFSKGIFSWVGFDTRWIEYRNVERAAGSTKWNFFSLMHYAVEGIVSFSEMPLQLASLSGIVMFVLSLLSAMFIVLRAAVFGDPVAGWPSLACIVLFVGGIQLMCLGVFGRYLANIFIETKKRPMYLISETDSDAYPISVMKD